MPRLLHHISARYQIDARIFYICLIFFEFTPSSSPKIPDFTVTEFVAVLIFAIFWPEHISNPLFQSIVRRL